jgi:hypothetical protein
MVRAGGKRRTLSGMQRAPEEIMESSISSFWSSEPALDTMPVDVPGPAPSRAQVRDGRDGTGLGRFFSSGWRTVALVFHRPRRVRFGTTETPAWLQSALSNPLARDSLRGHFADQRAGADLEFLLSYWAFRQATNSLQRFQLLSLLIHRFLRPNAERRITLSDDCRRDALLEWGAWHSQDRCPRTASLPALEKAAMEIHDFLSSHGPLSPGVLAVIREPFRWNRSG